MPDTADTVLPALLDATRGQPGHLARVLKLGAHHTLPQAVPSVLAGKEVSDVVAALVADTNAELADDEVTDLTGSSLPEARTDEIATRLQERSIQEGRIIRPSSLRSAELAGQASIASPSRKLYPVRPF